MRGRKTVLEREGLTLEDVRDAYYEHGYIATAAESLKMSERTMRKYLDLAGVERKRGRKLYRPRETRKHYACLAEWIRTNPDTPLPRSVKAISELTGCTRDEVATYLYRRREELRARIRKWPDLRKLKIRVYDRTRKMYMLTSWFRRYELRVHRFTFAVHIRANLKMGADAKFHYPIKDFEDRIRTATGEKTGQRGSPPHSTAVESRGTRPPPTT